MTPYKICNLYSGSRGNSTYISIAGVNIIIDAGKSAKSFCSSLSNENIDINSIDAIFVTHDHKDHTSALQTLSHKHKIPIYIVLASAEIFRGLYDERLCECLFIQPKCEFSVNIRGVNVTSFPTYHDSRASVGYRISHTDESGEITSIGYATDVGCISLDVERGLRGVHAVVLESNHDAEMLMMGPYPHELKLRIASRYGHLSNSDSAEFAATLASSGTKHFMLAHLSEENNTPQLAENEFKGALAGENVTLDIADQNRATWIVENFYAKGHEA